MFSNQALESMLNELIDKRIKNAFKNKGLEIPYDGCVESVTQTEGNTDPYSQYVDVFIVGYDITVKARNLSGEFLQEKDRVRIYATNGNLSNGYIGIKCN